jgi:glycosyltransferase involved in cell wall biosynthesis
VVDGKPLAFFHFSGFDPDRPLSLSRHQNRIDVTTHPVLERILAEYADHVMQSGHAVSRNWPYTYAALGDGTEINDFVRSLCEEFADDQERHGSPDPSPFTLAGAQRFHTWLTEEAPGGPPGINRILARIYAQRPDLRQAFPDVGRGDPTAFLTWFAARGHREIPGVPPALAASNGRIVSASADRGRPADDESLVPLEASSWGLNVVGRFQAGDEPGHTARRLIHAFDAGEIATIPVGTWTGGPATAPYAYEVAGPRDAPFPVNLICLDERGLVQFAAEAGEPFFAGRYSIALLLSATPDIERLKQLGSQLQEVWAPSQHVAGALQPLGHPVAVLPIPALPQPGPVPSREALGMPDDAYTFVSTFSYADGFDRKNPIGSFEAFIRAFRPNESAHLVIGCLEAGRDPGAHQRLVAAAAQHEHVHLIDDLGQPDELGQLRAAADCVVSLHRAETFGAGLAEAMWLGKPVIATGYSGNLDFMTAENSLLVEYQLVPAPSPGQETGGAWAEPDLAHAAARFRQAYDDPVAAHDLGQLAAATIQHGHSPAATGEWMARRLESIRATARVRPSRWRPQEAELPNLREALEQGPVRTARAGRAAKLRGVVRNTLLRLMRPYTSYQLRVNWSLATAVDVVARRLDAGAAGERARFLAEVRANRELRAAFAAQATGWDEIKRAVTLQTDRGLYLALTELGRRHEQVGTAPGPPPAGLGLRGFELRGYSQNGEDGVLAEILRRVGAPTRCFVEFGVESGREGNCVYLADVAGWSGLFMEADERCYRLLARKYVAEPRVQTMKAMVSPDNIEELLAQAVVPPEPDVMSIDVDGQDYWIWEAIAAYRPRVVVIEYNSTLDPRRRLVQPPGAGPWDGTEYFGASLGAIRSLGEEKGYRLVHTELAGSNAFLVPQELAKELFPDDQEVPMRGLPNYFQSGYRHPEDPAGRQYLDLDAGELVRAPGDSER